MSMLSAFAMRSAFSSSLSASARTTAARRCTGYAPHTSCAFFAAAIAASTSSSVESAQRASSAPVDGDVTGRYAPRAGATNAPPM